MKTADPTENVKVGDTINYTVVVTNSGNVTITGIKLEDTLVDLSNETQFHLNPGDEKEIKYEYTVTQADVDAGQIDNTVTATGKDPKDEDVTASDSAEVTAEDPAPELTVEKSADPSEDVAVGDEITYTVVVINTGNVTVTGITVEDTLVEIDEDAFDLAPGAEKEITYTYTVTQADVDAGKVVNAVTATGSDPSGDDVPGEDEVIVPTEDAAPELTIEKTATPTSGVVVGSEIAYTVVITNSGNVTITGITLEDTLVELEEEVFDLAPEGTKEINYTYTVTQADVDAGKIDNTVTATGKDPKDADVTGTDDATVTAVESDAQLTVEKTADPTSGVKVGDKVKYTVVVTNSGNVTVTDIAMSDTLVTLNEAAFDLAPAGTKTITYEYTVTQADVDAGKIDNTATATGKDPKNNDVSTSGSAEVTTVEAEPELTVEKTATPEKDVKVGDKITYTVKVTNTGNVTVTGITIDDTLVEIEEAAFDLAPGEEKTITYEYTVTQADVDAGEVANAVTATGKDPGGEPTPGEDEVVVPTEEPDPGLTVEKTADPSKDVKAGDVITYTVKVTNTGNVTVKDIEIEDTLVEIDEAPFTLAPKEVKTITYTYTVTQADVDAGKVTNAVTATGKDPDGDPTPGDDEIDVPTEEPDPELTVTKTADPEKDVAVGDVITYTVTVENTGNVTIKGIELEDTLVELDEEAFDLAPTEKKVITYTYTVTQADVDVGVVTNAVTATGTDPSGEPTPGDDEIDVPTEPADPELTVEKTADPSEDVAVGDVITYTVKVTNTGNVTIKGIIIEDTLVELDEEAFDLAPNEEKVITYTYTVTQADVDAGVVTNAVTATGKDPGGEPTPGDDEIDVPTEEADPSIKVEKSASTEGEVAEGGIITYTVKVTNTGNVTLSDVTLTDTKVELTEEPFTLAPNEVKTITYEYTVTKADDDAGEVENTAKAVAKDPHDTEVEDEDTVTTTVGHNDIEPIPDPEDDGEEMNADSKSITVMYDGAAHTVSGKATRPGSTIEYSTDGGKTWTTTPPSRTNVGETEFSIRATNPKYETVTKDGYKIIVTKRPLTLISASDSKLYDGTALTRNKQSDVEVIGLADTDTITFDITGTQTLVGHSPNSFTYTFGKKEIVKTSSDNAIVKLEETIKLAADETSLADNYEITKVEGTLTVYDKDPESGEIPKGITKKSHDGDEYALGETITFTIEVTNIYDDARTITLVEIDGMELDQDVFENVGPGEKITATATHVVTEDDILAGKVVNDVTAKFSHPDDEDTPPDFPGHDEVDTEDPNSHATIVKKVVNEKDSYTVGDTIEYEITITNDGNMTLTDIIVTDELTEDEWEIKELAPGESQTFTTEYKVTEEDADAGSVKNVATATGESIDPDSDPEIDPGDVVTPIAPPEKKEESDVPKTGDTTDLGSWVGLMVASLAGAGCTMIFKRKKEEEE